jgi:tRNA(Ile)-lysidine synthase
MHVIDRVRQFVRQHALADAATRVVVAVSGGSDSMALAELVRELAAAGDLEVAGVAHFNHQLRASADADEAFVRTWAASVAWPLVTGREDVAARARRERRSIEDAAHAARHAFFERARAHFDADVVALGHTRDDQAETVLLRLLRGAGPRGLAAMHPRRGAIVRPLLSCRREELRAYLAARHVAYVEDASNVDTAIPRNRVRAELLPLLEARFNPNIVNVLADQADIAREMSDWLDEEAGRLLRAAAVPQAAPGESALAVDVLLAAPPPVRRFAIRRAMGTAGAQRPIGFGHVEAVLRLLHRPAGRLDAPGQRVERVGSRLVFTGRPPGTTGRWANAANLFSYPLSIPGEVALPEAGCVVSAEWGGALDSREMVSNGFTARVRADLCAHRLSVRNRRPGDRFSPIGVGGRKKLQDFFVDRRVARPDRDRVPLVVDDANRIIWVAGYGIDEAFRITDPAQAVIILKLKHV